MGFLLSFLVPALVIGSIWLGPRLGHPNAILALPFVTAYILVPVVEAVWPQAPFQLSAKKAAAAGWTSYYRVLPLLSVPAQLAMVATATAAFVSSSLNLPARILLVLTTGVFSAMFAITVAHELIHRRQKLDRFLGGVLLSTVSFGTFKIVHLQVHHPYVGTPLDFATARRGQTI
jgi:alkane 1-monooxygenase